MKEKNVESQILSDNKGKYVKINNIIFMGKQNIDWGAVEIYLQRLVGQSVDIMEYEEKVFIDKRFADEYCNSNYTKKLKGGNAKAKANGAQGIIDMLKIAVKKRYMDNKKEPK